MKGSMQNASGDFHSIRHPFGTRHRTGFPAFRAKKTQGHDWLGMSLRVPSLAVLPARSSRQSVFSGRAGSTIRGTCLVAATRRAASVHAGKFGTIPRNHPEHGPCVRHRSRVRLIVPGAGSTSLYPGAGQPVFPCRHPGWVFECCVASLRPCGPLRWPIVARLSVIQYDLRTCPAAARRCAAEHSLQRLLEAGAIRVGFPHVCDVLFTIP